MTARCSENDRVVNLPKASPFQQAELFKAGTSGLTEDLDVQHSRQTIHTGDIGYLEGNITDARSTTSVNTVNIHLTTSPGAVSSVSGTPSATVSVAERQALLHCPLYRGCVEIAAEAAAEAVPVFPHHERRCTERRKADRRKTGRRSSDQPTSAGLLPIQLAAGRPLRYSGSCRPGSCPVPQSSQSFSPQNFKPFSPCPGEDSIEPQSGLELVWVPGGSFIMADSLGVDRSADTAELVVAPIRMEGFWLGRFPVTQQQYMQFMGANPSRFCGGGDYPVEGVSWFDAREFLRALSSATGRSFSLPTEAQWEYAARNAGRSTGDTDCHEPGEYAWYRGNSGGTTHPVGGRLPNGLGLYDMCGNVREWCGDRLLGHADDVVSPGPPRHHAVQPRGGRRVVRGGCWYSTPRFVQATSRYGCRPERAVVGVGFRVCLAERENKGENKE